MYELIKNSPDGILDTSSKINRLIKDIESHGPQFIISTGGTVYMLAMTTSGSFQMIKVTDNGLRPWVTARSSGEVAKDFKKNSYRRMDGKITVTLDYESVWR